MVLHTMDVMQRLHGMPSAICTASGCGRGDMLWTATSANQCGVLELRPSRCTNGVATLMSYFLLGNKRTLANVPCNVFTVHHTTDCILSQLRSHNATISAWSNTQRTPTWSALSGRAAWRVRRRHWICAL